MTVLGGALYAGFFGAAALWLAATSPDRDTADRGEQVRRSEPVPVRSGR